MTIRLAAAALLLGSGTLAPAQTMADTIHAANASMPGSAGPNGGAAAPVDPRPGSADPTPSIVGGAAVSVPRAGTAPRPHPEAEARCAGTPAGCTPGSPR